jgi:glycosyltransferase involved in cell wall biosynthesis
MTSKRIMIFAGFDRSLLNFRGPLIRAMLAAGHEVVACAPAELPGVAQALSDLGARFVPVDLSRTGLNPLVDLRYRRQVRDLVRRERPEVVLAYTIKPVVYGLPAAKAAGAPRVYALITGLGAAFNTGGLKGGVLRLVASTLYRRALRLASVVMVQNRDIAERFAALGITTARSKVMVVAGSGIDTDAFRAQPMRNGSPVFLLLARMLRDKGVEEYVAAARLVKSKYSTARFLLVGDTDPNPAAISSAQLQRWSREGFVTYLPAVADVRPLLKECTAYVLPSYHEGMPRSVLEAMASARPVITTDTIGCRETVMNAGSIDAESIRTGDNGLLVPVRNSSALAAAMTRFVTDFPLATAMGQSGRIIAEQQFDVRRINDVMLRSMDLLPHAESPRLASTTQASVHP